MATAATVGNPHLARASMDAATLQRQDAFLAAYPRFGTVCHACEAVGIDRESVRWWRKNDVLGFAERFQAAHEAYADYLEHLAHQRVTSPGPRTGSDLLLIAMLNANKPDKWRRDTLPVAAQRVQVTHIVINAPGQAAVTESVKVVEAQVALDDPQA